MSSKKDQTENTKNGVDHLKDYEKTKTEETAYISIRFAGDSGDGMQLTGDQFARVSATMGDDVITLADYPAEIRAPAGTIAGVSGFQLGIGSEDVFTTGDKFDVLIAMNPAALKANIALVKEQGVIIANEDTFTQKNLEKALYDSNPLEDRSLAAFRVYPVKISKLTETALESMNLPPKQVARSKNFFALGLLDWLCHRDLTPATDWINRKFSKKPEFVAGNIKALEAGWNYGMSTQQFSTTYAIKKPRVKKKPGTYRYINGNSAAALGLIMAARKAGLRLFLGSYPITPASEIMQELCFHKEFPVTTHQAEDEIAGIGTAIGASFAGALAATSTSGPGLALKSEFIGLAVIAELPLVIINVQRSGPSTGLPTKTEQADLLQAMWGRNGESPVVVLAAKSPSDCFKIAYEAARIALKYMTPVIALSDGYLANGAEPWRIPAEDELPEIKVNFHKDPETFVPYKRDPKTLARPWAIPGTPGLEHRIGGLEKEESGAVSWDPDNHEKMIRLRAEKIKRVADDIPPLKGYGDPNGKVLVVCWGSVYGSAMSAVSELYKKGQRVACLHLRYINPFPRDLGPMLKKYEKVLVVENNLGQLHTMLRAEYLIDAEKYNEVRGRPIRSGEIQNKVLSMLGEKQ